MFVQSCFRLRIVLNIHPVFLLNDIQWKSNCGKTVEQIFPCMAISL